MTKQELLNLKNGFTLKVNKASGYIDLFIHDRNNVKENYYLLKSERIDFNNIVLATERDVVFYILYKQIQLDQLERELKAGL